MPCHSRIFRELCTTGVGTQHMDRCWNSLCTSSNFLELKERHRSKPDESSERTQYKLTESFWTKHTMRQAASCGQKTDHLLFYLTSCRETKPCVFFSKKKKNKTLSKKSLLSSGLPPKNSKTNVCFIYLVWCWVTATLFNPLLTAFLSQLSLSSL